MPKICCSALQPIRDSWKQMYIIHYMDDILIAGQSGEQVLLCLTQLKQQLTAVGLQITPQKVQLQDPYTYLGFLLNGPRIINQKATIRRDRLIHLMTSRSF